MAIVSIREHSNLADEAIRYFQKCWANENSKMVGEKAQEYIRPGCRLLVWSSIL